MRWIATVTIRGTGTFSITAALRVFLTLPEINDATNLDDVIEYLRKFSLRHVVSDDYHRASFWRSVSNRDVFFPTTGGSLLLEAVGPNSSFTAITTATTTPEPSSLLLFGTSLLGSAPFGC
jgi:hypothetical protein